MHGLQVSIDPASQFEDDQAAFARSWHGGRAEATTADGHARVRVIAGEALGARAAIGARTPIVYQDWTLESGADVRVQVPATTTRWRTRSKARR